MATTPTNPVQPTPAVPLPAPPTLSDPDNFDERGDAFVLALSPMQQAINALADNAYTNALVIFGKAESAAQSANAANTSSSQAMGYRNEAGGYASAALAARDAAQGHAASVSSSLAIVDTRLLGGRALPPTTNNQGGAIAVGAMYYNTGSDPALKDRWYIWSGAEWKLGPGDYTGAFVPLAGAKMLGPLKVRPNATGEEAPQAQEVVPRAVLYYDKSIPMSAAPAGTVCFFESTDGGGVDWPYKTNVTIHGWLVETWDRGAVRSMQEATFTLSGFLATGAKFRRYKHDSNWSAWSREISDLDFRERVVTANTGVGPGAAKLYFVDPKVGSIHHVIVEYNTHFAQALRDFGDQATLRMQFSGGAWPVSFGADIRFPVGVSMPTYTAGQIVTVTFIWTRAGYIDAFIAGVHAA